MSSCEINFFHNENVETAKKMHHSHSYLNDVTVVFKLLGDATRLKIVWHSALL
jgi:hypothetical protein